MSVFVELISVMRSRAIFSVFMAVLLVFLSGCSTFEKARRADELESELIRLRKKMAVLSSRISELDEAKAELEAVLKQEIGDYKAKLEMTQRGLVITFLSEIFFDSGKDKMRREGKEILRKVALVLNDQVPDSFIAIEGHTDNVPIRYSGWKSNWELSCARALSVLHYLVDECGVAAQRLSVSGYGEYRPATSNDTPEGRQQNRRVEIVILPSGVKKVRAED
jgi:chemotaxis protein MotB